jgi:hypothetical protein
MLHCFSRPRVHYSCDYYSVHTWYVPVLSSWNEIFRTKQQQTNTSFSYHSCCNVTKLTLFNKKKKRMENMYSAYCWNAFFAIFHTLAMMFICLWTLISCCSIAVPESKWFGGIALGYGMEDRGFESRQKLGIFLFTTASRPALGPPSLLYNGYQGLFPWG